MTNKTCTRCKVVKPLADFAAHARSHDGKTSQCKQCRNEQVREWRAKNPDYHSVKAKESYYANPEHHRARVQRWRESNPEKNKAYLDDWFRRNKDKAVAKSKPRLRKWKRLNSGSVNADTARRYASKTRSTPPWVDLTKVKAVYAQAALMRKCGEDVHVDHIVPIRSALVCGLHVHWNLRIVGSVENMKKGNREWPNMP